MIGCQFTIPLNIFEPVSRRSLGPVMLPVITWDSPVVGSRFCRPSTHGGEKFAAQRTRVDGILSPMIHGKRTEEKPQHMSTHKKKYTPSNCLAICGTHHTGDLCSILCFSLLEGAPRCCQAWQQWHCRMGLHDGSHHFPTKKMKKKLYLAGNPGKPGLTPSICKF